MQLEVLAEAIDRAGQGVANVEGGQILIGDLAPGERARVEIEHVSKGAPRAHARVIDRLESLPGRREAPCPNHTTREGACTGCPLMTWNEDTQRALIAQHLGALGLDAAVRAAPTALGYRCSAKRVVFRKGAHVRLGSYVSGTHRPADMRGCLVDHPLIREAADEIAVRATELKTPIYRPGRERGLRYVWLKTDGTKVLVTLIWGLPPDEHAEQLAEALTVAGVTTSVQSGTGNAMRGGRARRVRGLDSLQVQVGEVEATVGPLGFLQPNLEQAERFYRTLLSDETGTPVSGDRALDLYAGAGLTTQMLKPRFREVLPCESHPESANALGVRPEKVGAFLADRRQADFVVANPPRKGLGAEVCEALLRLGAPRLHLMSCGPSGLANDVKALKAKYRVASIDVFDSLPQTPHVEIVVRLVYNQGSGREGSAS